MKNLQKLSAATLLIFMLTFSTFAGDMHAPSKDGAMDTPLAGEIGTPGIAGDISTPGIAGEIGTPGIAGDILTPGLAGDILIPGIAILRSALSLF